MKYHDFRPWTKLFLVYCIFFFFTYQWSGKYTPIFLTFVSLVSIILLSFDQDQVFLEAHLSYIELVLENTFQELEILPDSSEYVGGVLARSKPPISCLLLEGVTNVTRNENMWLGSHNLMWKSYGQRELIGLKNTIRKCAFSFFFFLLSDFQCWKYGPY